MERTAALRLLSATCFSFCWIDFLRNGLHNGANESSFSTHSTSPFHVHLERGVLRDDTRRLGGEDVVLLVLADQRLPLLHHRRRVLRDEHNEASYH